VPTSTAVQNPSSLRAPLGNWVMGAVFYEMNAFHAYISFC